MLSMLAMCDQNHNDLCFLCSNILTEIKSYPNVCDHLFHYKCLRKYVDSRLDKSESIICPICSKIFNQIGNKYKKSKEILYQNVILSNDETQCCICFSKYKCPVASTDSCTHTFCFECLKKWCTFKHECPMDRMPIKLLLLSDFPGGHITKKEEPPPIEQDLNCDGDNDEILNTTCEICNLGNNDHLLLLCDNCNRGYHIYCLADPLNEIPEGDWFCEECSEYMGINNQRLPRGIRGLQEVIDNLESRMYDQENHSRNPTNRRQPGRGRRNNTRANINTSSDDSDFSDQVLRRSRVRRTINRRRSNDVLRRSRRNRVINSDEEESVVEEIQNEIVPSNDSNNELPRNEIVNEESEEQETELEESEDLRNCTVSRTHSEGSSSDKKTTARRRHRQGSLSSEAESELEPSRKKIKTSESSTSDDDESVTSLQVTTRKRARARVEDSERDDEDDDDDDSPLPRPVKRLRMIDESSDESSDESRPKCKVRKIVESNSSDSSEEDELEIGSDNKEEDEEEEEEEENEEKDYRKRNFSTSSSLSTIPCRAPSTSRSEAHSSTKLPAIKQRKSRSCTKVEDIFSDSSTKDSTDSDYEPFPDKTPQQPSTSRSFSTPTKKKKVKKGRRKSRRTTKKTKTPKKGKTTKKKRTINRKKTVSIRKSARKSQTSSSNLENNSYNLSTSLSLFGREKQLPVVSDEEMKIKLQVPRPNPTVTNTTATDTIITTTSSSNNNSSKQHNSTNTNILSEINEAQSNFRQISLSTVTRLSDGTLIHKTRQVEPIITNENKDPKNISHNVPSTSSQLPVHSDPVSSSTSSTSSSSNNHAADVQQSKPPIQQVQPIIQSSRPAATPTQAISFNSSNSIPENTNAAKSSSPASSDTHITDISVTITKFLNKYLEKGKITADESKSLCDRIKEKIMKRNNQRKTPGESSIKEFSKKYLEFYLKKRK